MKSKKSLIAIIAVLLIAVVGVTFAYFNSSAIFENQFNLGNYNVVTQEVFTSPSDWAPGDVTPKTLIARNNGTINAAVRVKYEEEWTDSNGDEISTIPNDAVILNFTTPSNWTYDSSDGYYYYNYYLKSGQTTTSLTDSVTLNSNLNEANCVEENGVQTCTSDIQGLAGATYTLTFTIETCQYDQYQEVWDTEQVIGEKPSIVQIMNNERTKNTLQFGDEICINGDTTECFNFVRYDGDNVVMLSRYNLKVGLYDGGAFTSSDSGYGLQSIDDGIVGFSSESYWDSQETGNLDPKYGSSYPADVYDSSVVVEPVINTQNSRLSFLNNGYSIAYYVENYKSILESYGVSITSARLLTLSEATSSDIGCTYNQYADYDENTCPDSFITNASFWLGTAGGWWTIFNIYDNYLEEAGFSYNDGDGGVYGTGVRPVIVISKSEIE